MIKNPCFAVGISMLSLIVLEIIRISGFGGHFAVSGCLSLFQSLADTFFELREVVNP